MVVMALDHTRDFFHYDALISSPTDLSKAGASLFLTRWVTHFCAPGFLFLAGLSAYLRRAKSSKKELSRYLLTRGLWLMLLDITVLRFAVMFNFYLNYNLISILWLIGLCMVLLSGVIFLRHWAILTIALIIIFGHNLTDGLKVGQSSPFYVPWVLLYNGGPIQISPSILIFIVYATIPWLGIMMFGYFVGRWYGAPFTDKMRRRLMVYTGTLAIILFFFFRYTGFYGDPSPAVDYPDAGTSMLSFMNVSKYPVSLQFTLMTLGPLMIALAALEKVNTNGLKPLLVFGRVPLFYFLLHFFVIHIAALVVYMLQKGKSFSELDFHFPNSFGGLVAGEAGVSLFWTYVAWAVIVIALYPVCKWFERYRRVSNSFWVHWI
jgi:uncharacterized membrane protein